MIPDFEAQSNLSTVRAIRGAMDVGRPRVAKERTDNSFPASQEALQ